MRHLMRNLVLTVAVLVVCLLNIFPVDESLRLGKDLAGGASLVYAVEVKPDDPPDVIDRTIAVLKDRVNPQGLYEIAFVQQGRDRIEITMPLPNEKVRTLRRAYDAALKDVDGFEIDHDALQRAMRLSGPARAEALEAMSDTPGRRSLLAPVMSAIENAQATRANFQSAQALVTDQAELDRLLAEAGEADEALDTAREAALASGVSGDQLRAALELPGKGHRIRDDAKKEMVEIPSARERALTQIRERVKNADGAGPALDAAIAAHAAYSAARKGLDDPADLVRLLQGAGVLNFRISVAPNELGEEARLRRELRERGPANVQGDGVRWLRINKVDNWYDDVETLRQLRDTAPAYFASRYNVVVEERDGVYWLLCKDAPGVRLTAAEGAWSLTAATRSVDEFGKPSVAFRMNPRGASLLGDLTERHRGRQMAIVLDDQVISAPTLQSRISTNGQITGNFGEEELNYLIKTMAAGSLQAKLSPQPISQSILAPDLGADNLKRGLDAAWIAMIAVSVFMIFYYFTSGAVAVIALIANAIIVLGIMSLNKAAFTLPGIAGVVLTFGTAVDSNVLIYERIREELEKGNDLRQSVRTAFSRVASTIIDANATNLIVCLVLVYTGTQEIKGFGITLGIGTIATMFCALVVTRLIFTLLVDHLKVKRLSQLPMALPGLSKALVPSIDWMKLFPVFVVVSLAFMALGIYGVFFQGSKMLSNEFRGGTAITLQLEGPPAAGGGAAPLTLTRPEVKARVDEIAQRANTGAAPAVLSELRNAEVVPINPRPDGVTSERFVIRTTVTDETALREAVAGAFSDVVQARRALSFRGSDVAQVTEGGAAPVEAVVEPSLGALLGRPEVLNRVDRFIGGAAVVMADLQPALSRDELVSRLEYMRADRQFSEKALRRDHEIIVVDGTDDAVKTAVLVVSDPTASVFDDEGRWRTELAQNEWDLVRAALTQTTSLAGFNSFSPAVAQSFRAQAIVAVLMSFLMVTIYVWVRFGSLRYSLASILPLVHDVLITIGLIAAAEIAYELYPGIAALGIRPYKIDMGMVAAIMAIIGFSLNDTIVILDRIRENRGKLVHASKQVINDSINQTMSRTFITAGTTLVSLIVLYVVGGEGVASFSYAMLCGTIVGTYSSIAVAAPIVYERRLPPAGPFPRGEEGPSPARPALGATVASARAALP